MAGLRRRHWLWSRRRRAAVTVPRIEEAWPEAAAAGHYLLGGVCVCGEWSAGCGENIVLQWHEHMKQVEAARWCAICQTGGGRHENWCSSQIV
jgi:hypothetical protein